MPATWMTFAREGAPLFSARTFLPSAVGVAVLLCGVHARAQCSMDTECEGERICEGGSCVDPAPALLAAPTSVAPTSVTPLPLAASAEPRLVRHSEVLRGVGILSVVLGGAALVSSASIYYLAAGCGFGECDSRYNGYLYDGLLTAAVLTGVGVPLIVIGSRKEPATPKSSATVSPWVVRQSAGLSLRLEL